MGGALGSLLFLLEVIMQDDIKYTIGALKTEVQFLTQKFEDMEDSIEEIKKQTSKLDRWEQRTAGAITILSVVGAAVLYLGDGLIQLIKTKLGL